MVSFLCCGRREQNVAGKYTTIRSAPFGKMNKNTNQLFTCFLAAAERYRAPIKEEYEQNNAIPEELKNLQLGQDNDRENRGRTIIDSTSREHSTFQKYLERIHDIVNWQAGSKTPFNSVSHSHSYVCLYGIIDFRFFVVQ